MSGGQADLLDTLSPKLARYAAVDPALSQALDPSVRRLVRWSGQFGQLAVRDTRPAESGQQPPLAGEA